MKKMHFFTRWTLFAAIGVYSVSAFAQSNNNINVKTSTANGLCSISVPGGNAPETEKPMQLEFTLRPSDGLLRIAALVNGWPRAQEADPNRDFPVSLKFDTQQSTASDSGGYSSGFYDRLWGIWEGGDSSNELLLLLADAQSVEVSADGLNLGQFNLQAQGMVYNWLNNCVVKQRAAGK